MKKACMAAILGLLVCLTLGAQIKPTLVIRNLTGGSGYDGRTIAGVLARQPLVLNTFTLVTGGDDPDYAISGSIRREGIRYAVALTIVNLRTGVELGQADFSYRDQVEITALAAAAARALTEAVLPEIAPPPELIEPEPAAPEEPVIPEEPIALAEPEPLPEPLEPEPVEPEPLPEEPVKLPEEPKPPKEPKKSAKSTGKILNLSLWGGFAYKVAETSTYTYKQAKSPYHQYSNANSENEKATPISFGLELAIRAFEHLGSRTGIIGTALSEERELDLPGVETEPFKDSNWAILYYEAGEYVQDIGPVHLSIYLGPTYYRHNGEYNNKQATYVDIGVGALAGTEMEIDLGPGRILANFNLAYLLGISEKFPANPTVSDYNPKGSLKNATAYMFGIGYRIGVIAK
jgi:hypothetical protein